MTTADPNTEARLNDATSAARPKVKDPPRTDRAARAVVMARLSAGHGGVAHRDDLRAAGVHRADVRSEIVAGRWASHGRHTVAASPGELTDLASRWHAVWEVGGGSALDGAAALIASGLTGYRLDRLDVSIPHANRHRPVVGVTRHRRRTMPPTVGAGIPRVRPEHAVLHAAGWAVSDRQATLLLCMVIQQRLIRAGDLLAAAASIERSKRRALIQAVVRDICTGAQSLGELDFAALCRRRGLPEPTRQVMRETPDGRIYLDLAWEDIGLVVEIDGGHHQLALNPVDDALRQNDVAIGGDIVLRIPLVGLRLAPDRFMNQLARAHATLSRLHAA